MTIAGVGLVAIAGCTSEQTTSPGSVVSVGESTTSTTSTIAPVEATVATTVTSTVAATTTTATVASVPPETSAMLLIGGAEGGWLYLGSWQGRTWVEDPSGVTGSTVPTIAAGSTFAVSNLDGDQVATTGSDVEACLDGRTGPTMSVTVPAPDPPGYGFSAIATSAHDLPLSPRPAAVVSTAPETYQVMGQAIFAGDPVDASLGSVEQVVIADLDGDGDDEAIVSFEYVQPAAGPGVPGDLATLFIVDTTTRTPATVVATHVPPVLPDEVITPTVRYRVIDVADYNGDGRMEVAVHAWYYEGASVTIYEYDGTSLREALTTGCGA